MAAVYEGDLWEDYFARPGILDFEPLPVGVIVTAAGTGSEMNGSAVITNEKKIKTGRDYPQCNPRFALMDPVYTYSVPIRQMVSGGFTTLSHIMETYFGKPHDDDNVSDDMAEALMKGVIRDMRAAMKDPQDYRTRSNLMWQASMAGNRMLNLGKQADLQCRHIGHQLGEMNMMKVNYHAPTSGCTTIDESLLGALGIPKLRPPNPQWTFNSK